MTFERDGAGTLHDLIPRGWAPSRSINVRDDGAPDVPVTVPSLMDRSAFVPAPSVVQSPPPVVVPAAAPTTSGVMLEPRQAMLFGEVFQLTQEEVQEVAAILARAYERRQQERVASFRMLHALRTPALGSESSMHAMQGEATKVEEAAGPVPTLRKTRKKRQRKVQQVHRGEAGDRATTPEPRHSTPHTGLGSGSPATEQVRSDGDEPAQSAEGGGDTVRGQVEFIGGVHPWQLSTAD